MVIIGALNWGIVGTFIYNPILALLGVNITRIIYIAVGVSALVLIVFKVLKMRGGGNGKRYR